jgi:SAM-dependent MidA family methyltransferase
MVWPKAEQIARTPPLLVVGNEWLDALATIERIKKKAMESDHSS